MATACAGSPRPPRCALCGHATLASAHALWETGRLPLDATARFYTLSGLLTARRNGDWIELNFPARPPQAVDDRPDWQKPWGKAACHVSKMLMITW